MSVFVPNSRHLWEVFIFCFHLKKTAAEAELLKPSETITGGRYRTQLLRLGLALREKQTQYQKRHDKVILQHDNARIASKDASTFRDGIRQLTER